MDAQHDKWSYVVGHLFAPLEAGVFTVTVALYSPGNLLLGMAGGLSQWVLAICLECLNEGVAVQVLDIRGQIITLVEKFFISAVVLFR